MKKSTSKGAKAGAEEQRKLTPKQAEFCQQYLIDLNGTQAAIRAGYSAHTANEQAARLLAKVSVGSHIRSLMEERSKRTQITQDRVLQELARVAFSDLRRAFREDGTLKLPHEMDDDTAAALAGIDTNAVNVGGADDPTTLTTRKIKVFGKTEALTLAMRHLGMLNDKLEVTLPEVVVKDWTGKR